MKQKSFLVVGVVLSLLLTVFGVYKMLEATNATGKNLLINISELSKEFMEEYLADYAEMAANDNKGNILIVSSKTPLASDFGAKKVVKAANNQYFLEYVSVEARDLAYEQLKRTPNLTVTENYLRTVFDGNEEDGGYNSWGIEKMGLDYASGLVENATSKNDVIVAIADTGLDVDLFKENYPAEKLAGMHSVVNPDGEMEDEVGHGTHVAGTIAEGTPSNVKIYPVQLSESRSIYSTDIVAAIDYIVYYTDADVINMSFGGYEYAEAEYLSLEAAKEKGMVSVAAAGNDATSNRSFPASFDNTISISAVDSDLKFATEFSNFNSMVDFAAPGVGIKSINATWDGTSMATPHVAAAAAIAKSLNKDFTVDSARDFLATRAIDLGAKDRDSRFGFGFIDFNEARLCVAESETCDEFGIFEKEVEDGIEIGEVVLTPYNYGSVMNLLATTIKIKNKSGSYKTKQLGDLGTDVEVMGYNPYTVGEQEVTVIYNGFETVFTVENPETWESGWEYSEVYNFDTYAYDSVALAGYKEHNLEIKTLVIPEVAEDGRPVTESYGMFYNNYEDTKYYETLVFPVTFRVIRGFGGDTQTGKFQNLYKVVSLADEVAVANYGLGNLENLVTIEGKMNILKENYVDQDGHEYEAYDPQAFAGDKALTSITLSENLDAIPDGTFSNCKSLETIELPDAVVEIERNAFSESGIKMIDLKNVQKLGEGAFMWSGLEEINIPAGLTEIGQKAFYGTEMLKTLTVAADHPVFDGHSQSNAIIKTDEKKLMVGISTTVIPEGVKIIGESAFEGVTALDEIVIPEGVETIEAGAFKECFYLQKVVMPRSLTTIDEAAFMQAGRLTPSRTVFWIWSDSYAKEWVFERDLPYVLMDNLEEEPKLIADATFEVIPEGRDYYAFDTLTPENFIIKIFYWDEEAERAMEEPEIVTVYTVIYNGDSSESLNGGYNNVTFVFDTAAGYKNIKIDLSINAKYLTPEYEVTTGITAYSGQALTEIELPEGFSWMNGEEFVEEGMTEYLARFTPEDLTHYEVVKDIAIPIEVKVGETLEEVFPDEALRACIVENFGGEAELEEVLNMVELDCANLGAGERITNARGIERMTKLKSLNLASNSLERINLSKNVELESLDLRANKIRSLDIVNNLGITELLVDESGLEGGEPLVLKTVAYLERVYAEDGSSKAVMDISKLEFLKDVDWTLEDSSAVYNEETGAIEWETGGVTEVRIAMGLESGETIAYTIYGFARSVYITTLLDGKIYDKDFSVGYTYTGNIFDLDKVAEEVLTIYGLSGYVLEDVVVANEEPREYVVGMDDVRMTLYFKSKKKKDEPVPVDPDDPEPIEPSGDESDSKGTDVKVPDTGVFTARESSQGGSLGFISVFYFALAAAVLIITIVLPRVLKYRCR